MNGTADSVSAGQSYSNGMDPVPKLYRKEDRPAAYRGATKAASYQKEGMMLDGWRAAMNCRGTAPFVKQLHSPGQFGWIHATAV